MTNPIDMTKITPAPQMRAFMDIEDDYNDVDYLLQALQMMVHGTFEGDMQPEEHHGPVFWAVIKLAQDKHASIAETLTGKSLRGERDG